MISFVQDNLTGITSFFAYARERHAVYLRRKAGQPWPWTDDEIIRNTPFCNVYRELDKTTVWFREHVRDRLRDDPMVLPATVIFRWFNRIRTGEALFQQNCLPGIQARENETAFEAFMRLMGDYAQVADVKTVGARAEAAGLQNLALHVLKSAIVSYCGRGPYVTGAYTINTLSAGLGKSKLDGVLNLIGQWFDLHKDWSDVAQEMMEDYNNVLLEQFCQWCRSPCLGEFMTYEIACDLRHTALLSHADDINTWANLGPGARRGLNRIFRPGVKPDAAIKLPMALEEMHQLLECSRQAEFWPESKDHPKWELREVEHTLCEFDKYCRVREGSGRPRGSAPRG